MSWLTVKVYIHACKFYHLLNVKELMISNYVPLFIAWGVVGWYKLNILMSDTIIKGTTLLIVIFKM